MVECQVNVDFVHVVSRARTHARTHAHTHTQNDEKLYISLGKGDGLDSSPLMNQIFHSEFLILYLSSYGASGCIGSQITTT